MEAPVYLREYASKGYPMILCLRIAGRLPPQVSDRIEAATGERLRPLSFSVEPPRSAGGSDPVIDRSFESIAPAVSQTDCRSKG
jgi:hypothetical protein